MKTARVRNMFAGEGFMRSWIREFLKQAPKSVGDYR